MRRRLGGYMGESRYSLEETFPATEAERAEIERSAKAKGTWLKAPNGQDTKLTPKQWVTVRTAAFKKWFGDWEKDARIEKLRRSEPLVFTGEEYKGKYELDARSAERYILDNLRGEYVNKDTGERISVSRRGVRKVLHHDVENEVHLKSIAYIPQMLENAVFVSEELNAKSTTGFDSYRYYVCGLEIGGEQYTAKLVVGKLGRETYYDHVLSPIKKDTLLKGIGEIPSPRAQKKSISTEIRDKRLLSILQTNSSKIVDENGEPLVAYHGTSRGDRVGNIFDPARATSGPMAYFTTDRGVAEGYSKTKSDTSLAQEGLNEDFNNRFLMRFGNGLRVKLKSAWGYVPLAKRREIAEKASHVKFDDDYNIVYDENNTIGAGNFDMHLREARGNVFVALTDEWLNSGNLFREDEAKFLEVLRLVGFDNVEYVDIYKQDPKVYEVFLNLRRPLDTTKISKADMSGLKRAAKQAQKGYDPEASRHVDDWDKTSISPQEWIEKLDDDVKNGTTYAWTIVPDFVTEYLRGKGYDGIRDAGGKYAEKKHEVLIPFGSTQIKSATENVGTFDAGNPDIRYSLGGGARVLRGEQPFPLAPKSGEWAAEKLGEFMPVPFAGNKKTIIEAHAELFRRIGELARSAGGRVIDAFAGAGTYTAGLGALGALPQGSVLNEWAASRYVMHKMLAKNPEGVAEAVRELLARFARSAELAEFRRKLEAVRQGAEEKTKLTQALVDWFNDELRGKHGVKYVEGTENSAFGDANLIESEASAAFYVVLQTLTTGSHPVNFKFDEKGKLFIEVANGVFRTGHLSTRLINAKGGFNENALNPEKYTKRIEATGRAYRAARLDVRRGDGWELAKTAKRGDVVFVDPAYLGVQAYGKSGVTATDANDKELAIARLADLAKWADARGASIVYTNEYSDKSGTGGMSQAEYAEVWEEALKRIGTETASVNYFDRQARGMGKGGEARADIVFATGAASHLLKTSRVELDAIKERYGAETDEEAEAIAWEAKTRGLSAEQLAQAEEWRRVRWSLGAAEQAAWGKVLDDYEAGRLPARGMVTVLPRTPAVLQRCGAANLPLKISKGVLDKVTKEKHGVPVRELRGLLVNLDNPIAVFRSRTQADSLVVLTELRDEANGNNAVVAVRLDAKSDSEHEINAVASIYGRPAFQIEGFLRDGLALYLHTKKIRAYLRSGRLQLPAETSRRGSSSLLTQDDFTQDELGVVKVNNKKPLDGRGEVYGAYDPRTREVFVAENARVDTLLHELGWHAAYDWARTHEPKLYAQMRSYAQSAPEEVRAAVREAYAGFSEEAMLDEIGAAAFSEEFTGLVEERLAEIKDGRRRGIVKRWWAGFKKLAVRLWRALTGRSVPLQKIPVAAGFACGHPQASCRLRERSRFLPHISGAAIAPRSDEARKVSFPCFFFSVQRRKTRRKWWSGRATNGEHRPQPGWAGANSSSISSKRVSSMVTGFSLPLRINVNLSSYR